MQTFLPLPDYQGSATVLDTPRLGKQRVEVLQIVRALMGETNGWRHHPCTKMWKGAELSLIDYGLAICHEWRERHHADTCAAKLTLYRLLLLARSANPDPPEWLGYDRFHASHRSNLLRKNPIHYAQFGWTEPPTLDYYWPLVINRRFFHG